MLTKKNGFTLIEISIVLAIIGLLAGGVLAGRELISAAYLRAQVSQVNAMQLAVKTFRLKYNCLAGDCINAESFGFVPSRNIRGGGDSNGVLEGLGSTCQSWPTSDADQVPYEARHFSQLLGENAVFWRDLSEANLIPNKLTYAENDGSGPLGCDPWACMDPTPSTSPSIYEFYPKAKIGGNNIMYVYSDERTNFFGLSEAQMTRCFYLDTEPTITVSDARNIDQKIDDGLPMQGGVQAKYLNQNMNPYGPYAAGVFWSGHALLDDPDDATAASENTCFDNGGVADAEQRYSTAINNGNSRTCGISFKFQ